MKYVNIDQVLALPRCGDYPEDRVRELFGSRKRVTLRTIAAAPIPAKDRLWVLIQLMPDRTRRLFACDCAERALIRELDAGREPDARSWRAVEVTRLYADGKATAEELAAAWSAAHAAAWAAAWAAAGAAARADARAAAWAAARAAAEDAAEDAARAAAWGAAEDAAAWAAAVAAAWAAAEDAEREWQIAHLSAMYAEERHD